MTDVFTQTLIADHITPVRAYACLRSHAPDRSSFLLESVGSGEGRGRFSIAGYRGASESLYAPGGDALPQLVEDLAAVADAPAGLAERFSQAAVGYVAYEAPLAHLGVKAWDSQISLVRLMRGATVAVFDHQVGSVTIAGPSRGSVKRAAWEMTHGPELGELKWPDPAALPEYVDPTLEDAAFQRRIEAAAAYVASGEVERVRIARIFRTAIQNAEPFEVYRALRALAPAPSMFFLDFATSPMAPGLVVAGAAAGSAVRIEQGAATLDGLREALPAAAAIGAPRARAAAIVRELEAGPRGIYAGAIGYGLPDGAVDLALTLRALVFENDAVEVVAGAMIEKATAPADAVAANREDVRPALAAVRAAQDAATERVAAEEARRARLAKEQGQASS